MCHQFGIVLWCLSKYFYSTFHQNTTVILESVKTLGCIKFTWQCPIPSEYMSKIVQCRRLVSVFVKQRQDWLWAELCTPPLKHYIKPEPQLGTVFLQRHSMRPWLSNAKAMTPLTLLPWHPPVSLVLSVSKYLLPCLFSFFPFTAHIVLNSI